jgi:subtilisin
MRKQLIPALSILVFSLAVFMILSLIRDLHPKAISQGQSKEAQDKVSDAELSAALAEQKQAATQLTRSAAFDQRFQKLSLIAQQRGTVSLIVRVRATFSPEGQLASTAQRLAQRKAIEQAQDDLLTGLHYAPSSLTRYKKLPYLALSVDTQGMAQLLSSANVLDLFDNKTMRLATADSLPLVGAPRAWAADFSGTDKTIALLDSGVDKNHPSLSQTVVSEACFSTNDPAAGYSSLCPGGAPSSTEVNSGLPCTVLDDLGNCDHGTHIAGIVASGRGVAYSAKVISIQVMSLVNDSAACRDNAQCLLAKTSDVLSALNRVYDLHTTHTIAAVNISLASDGYTSNCDAEFQPMRDAIQLLRSVDIATVIASGNESYSDALSYPACISSAISVGATGDGSDSEVPADTVAGFSNSASFLKLFAPGNYITSTIPGGGFASGSGTSMAAAHVSGAWALLKQRYPSATVDEILNKLTTFGVNIRDSRNPSVTKPRIRVDDALEVAIPPDNWVALYYNNTELAGEPVLRRNEGGGFLDRDFTGVSPAPGVNPDHYSISWTRTLSLLAGNYRFSVTGKDGVRLFIDGRLLINQWVNHPVATTYNIDVNLQAGKHEVRVEYYRTAGDAQIRLTWEAVNPACSQAVTESRWRAEYFNNPNLAGNPVSVRDEGVADINYDWGSGAPVSPCHLFPDRFSARWARKASFLATTYTFTVTNIDDGVRLFVDGVKVIDRWVPASGTHSVDVDLTEGMHQIILEYYEGGGLAQAKLSWAPKCHYNVPGDRWRGEYFNNANLAGSPAMVRNDGNGNPLDFNWGDGGPSTACGFAGDYFSVRWTRNVYFDGGPWRFTVFGDNGVRLWIDNQLTKIDRWTETVDTNITVVHLSAGWHEIRFEFFETFGGAAARLSWNSAADCFDSIQPSDWKVEFYDNPSFSGLPVMVRKNLHTYSNGVSVNFGNGSPGPACGIQADNFSVRWSRNKYFDPPGYYRFHIAGDDVVRLYLHGGWVGTNGQAMPDLYLGGNTQIRVDFIEYGGAAVASLSWQWVAAEDCPPACGPNIPNTLRLNDKK